ncbi:hypothetical protein GSI_14205 [Ganoderma sinense ZZ0214-1]|uniref:Uncharacterized protein n=1 Tax=Ganoderma sinense ZZ0214-1 TaxID=1077348 RepID=A0A2G8RSI1_9APHY|nr:hypothetical protein GSI_14205 [Ganoderma sinense ZZ0214-1]
MRVWSSYLSWHSSTLSTYSSAASAMLTGEPPVPPCTNPSPLVRFSMTASTRAPPRSVSVAPLGDGAAGSAGTSENHVPCGPPQKSDWRRDADAAHARWTRIGLWSVRMEPLGWRKLSEA